MTYAPQPAIYQPEGLSGGGPGSVPVNGVTIRYLQNTQEDADFAGACFIEAFRGKIKHNVTERKLPIAQRLIGNNNLNQYDSFYKRTLVALYEGRPVGVCQIKCKGDSERNSDDGWYDLGCWHLCRMMCFDIILSESVDDRHKCYVSYICVDSTARGKGVGKLLLDRAEYEARMRGCNRMYLHVTTDNRARNLYERQGYVVTSRASMCGCMGCCIGPPGSVYEMVKQM